MDIQGPAGAIETRVDHASNPRAIAVLAHPHPLYGGSMHDGVLTCVTEVFLAHHISCVRFNFRGVGQSAGTHDGGEGEVDDLICVAQAAAGGDEQFPLWLAGYSFGALMTVKASPALSVEQTLLIAPPNAAMDFSNETLHNDNQAVSTTKAIAGELDQFVNFAGLSQLLGPGNVDNIVGADHFFSGRQAELTAALERYLEATVR